MFVSNARAASSMLSAWTMLLSSAVRKGEIRSDKVVLATGGRSLPKTGSDGYGYSLVKSLGHTLTPRIFPALVPLTLPRDHFICSLSGVTVWATLDLHAPRQAKSCNPSPTLRSARILGYRDRRPETSAAITLRRSLTTPARDSPSTKLPGSTAESVDTELRVRRSTVLRRYAEALPERLLRALCAEAGVDATTLVTRSRARDAERSHAPSRNAAADYRKPGLHLCRGDGGRRAALRAAPGDDGIAPLSRTLFVRRNL